MASIVFDKLCAKAGIEHRLTPVCRPQTNGMVERFNGRISDVLASHRFDSQEALETTLKRYCHLYNHHIPQRALNHRTPIQAMKDWQTTHPQLFIRQVRNHTGPDTYSSAKEIKRNVITVGAVCRMVPQKDLPTLLRGFAKAHAQSEAPLSLKLVGDGPERRNIDRLIRELNIENAVELTGALPRDEVYETLADMDIFVVSSRWEGFCNAMVEAGAAAKAILATDIDPLPEVIGRENAVFFNAGDTEALGKQLLELSVDSRHREKLGQRARDFVRNRYSLELSAERYRKVYEALADELQGERG